MSKSKSPVKSRAEIAREAAIKSETTKVISAVVHPTPADEAKFKRRVLLEARCAALRAELVAVNIRMIGDQLQSGAIDADTALEMLAEERALRFFMLPTQVEIDAAREAARAEFSQMPLAPLPVERVGLVPA